MCLCGVLLCILFLTTTWSVGKAVTPNAKSPVVDEARSLPRSFDARKVWPHCKSIGHIPSQGVSGKSCWAVASAGIMTDRLCLRSKGRRFFEFSVKDVASCCSAVKTFKCKNKCINGLFASERRDDKDLGMSIHVLPRNGSKSIQKDIKKYGPVLAKFQMYKDFITYQEGIYTPQVKLEKPMWHWVSLVGWGEEKQIKYWWARNNWGEKWGNLGGFFKIRRGKNDASIETYVHSIRFQAQRRSLSTDETSAIPSSFEAISPNVLLILNLMMIAMYLSI